MVLRSFRVNPGLRRLVVIVTLSLVGSLESRVFPVNERYQMRCISQAAGFLRSYGILGTVVRILRLFGLNCPLMLISR